MKTILLFLVCLFIFQSCTTIKCSVANDLLNDNTRKITIVQDNDPINLKEKVTQESKKLGFDINDFNDSLNASLSYSYIHYFDAFHYTLNLFSIIIVKNDTKEVLASAFCTGDSPSGAGGIISGTFTKLGEKVKALKKSKVDTEP
jgi:hypothetical protein